MLERDRIELRRAKAFAAAEEAAAKEAEERPVREALEEANRVHQQLHAIIKERILNMPDVDAEGVSHFWIDPDLAGVSMDRSFAGAFDADSYLEFLREHSSWFYDCEFNRKQLFSYCERNSAQIFNAEMLRRAALRLQEYRLLEERPDGFERDPATGGIIIPRQEPMYVNLSIERPPAPPTYKGWDEQTGLEREFTQREVDRLSADQYRRIFRVKRSDMELPSTGPGPMGFRG